MKKLSKWILSITAPITVVSTASLATSCGKKIEYGTIYYKTPEFDKNNYVEIDAEHFSDDLIVTLESLQGIMAQKQAYIYIVHSDHVADGPGSQGNAWRRDQWYLDMKNKLGWSPTQTITTETDAWNFILSKRQYYHNKYVLYEGAKTDPQDWNKSINLATTIAGMENYLMIRDGQEIPAWFDVEQGIDARKARSHEVFYKYKDRLNNKLLVNDSPYDVPLRDYAIANRCLTIYLDDETNYFRNEISDWMEDNYPILGWNKGELGFVASQADHNLPILCSDHVCNLSFYSHFVCELQQKYKHNKITADPSKHYVAIVMSDGDSLQWMQGNYPVDERWYGSQLRGDWPMTWSVTPSAYDLNPQIIEYMFNNMSENDEFICGPSGYSYTNMSQYHDRKAFAEITADYMKKCDVEYINTIDYYDCDYQKFDELLKQDQVKGLAWSNRDLYMSGHGSVDWINNKPIVSMREGLWSDGKDPGLEGGWKVHPELSPIAVANRINEYPVDIHKIDGYTIITSNCWAQGGQMTVDGLQDLVNHLGNNVEIVTLSQILQMITDNVPHVSAVPEAYGPSPDVPD